MRKKQPKAPKGLVPSQDSEGFFDINCAIELAKTVSNAFPENLPFLAFDKMRDELNASAVSSIKRPDQWTVADIIFILTAVEKFIENTMSTHSDEGGEVIIIDVHPAALALKSFIGTLTDTDKTILEKRLKQTVGNRLTSSERSKIGLALTWVKMVQRQKGITLQQARENVARHLKKLDIKVRQKPVSAASLKEWAKDYDLNGHKKWGK